MCKEREIKMFELELDLDEKTVAGLIEYASANILKDTDALINWAANDILKQLVETDGKILEDENGES